MPELSDFDLGDYDLCDEHEWAGVGDCPKCLEECAEEMAQKKAREDAEYFELQRREGTRG